MTLTKIHFAAPFYVTQEFSPMVMDDMGNAVSADFMTLSHFLNNEFTSIPAALEYYGVQPEPLPVLI